MNKGQILIRRISYSIGLLAGSLCLVFLTVPSFGSDHFTQEEVQEKILATASKSQIAVPFSPEGTLPLDLRVHILTFLSQQKDVLRIGAVSKNWRKAVEKVWRKRTLDLSNKPLRETDYQALAKGIFPHLKLKNVKLNDEGIMILATCSRLQALDLSDNNLSDTQALLVLLSLPMLTQINLGYTQIWAKGAKAIIAQALKGMTSLTSLSLSSNYIGAEGITALAPAVSTLTALTTLDLETNQIRDKGAITLASTLKALTALTALDLYNNQIGAIGITALAPALKTLTALTSFNLWSNQIGVEGATALAPSLKALTALTSLNLSTNRIEDAGIAALAPSLQALTALTSLHLLGNQIRAAGITALAPAVSTLTALTTLDLSYNQIGNEGKRALEDLKRSRPSLEIKY